MEKFANLLLSSPYPCFRATYRTFPYPNQNFPTPAERGRRDYGTHYGSRRSVDVMTNRFNGFGSNATTSASVPNSICITQEPKLAPMSMYTAESLGGGLPITFNVYPALSLEAYRSQSYSAFHHRSVSLSHSAQRPER